MAERIQAWQCIGCGRIDGPQDCIGVCQDRRVEFVYADELDEALVQLALAREQLNALSTFVRRVATTTPRAHEWEHTYRALQEQARKLLAMPQKKVI